MSAIDLRGVSKSYGEGASRVDALVDVDLDGRRRARSSP